MKSPAFQFYPQDFISSLDVQVMNVEQVGAYFLLLSNAWIHDPQGYLPNNEMLLQRICRMNDKQWAKNKELILKKFSVDGQYIFNPRLLKELEKQAAHREKQAENGRKGGRPPKKGTQEEPSENPKKPTAFSGETQTEPSESSSFSTSSSTSFSTSSSGGSLQEPEAPPPPENKNPGLFPEPLPAEPKKPKEKSSAKKEKVSIDYGPFDTQDFRDKWQEFKTHRASMKPKPKPITTVESEQRIFNTIRDYEMGFAIDLINAAIDNNWGGLVFPETPQKYQSYLSSKRIPTPSSKPEYGTTEYYEQLKQKYAFGNNA